MADTIITTNRTTTYSILANDDIILAPGVTSIVDGWAFSGLHDSNMSLTVLGTVLSTGTAINLGQTVTDTSYLNVTIGQTGLVSTLDAVAIELDRTAAELFNHGEILGARGAVEFNGQSGVLVNTGLIASNGVYATQAIDVRGINDATYGTFDINNSGTITSTDEAIEGYYDDVVVTNSGLIESTGLYAIRMLGGAANLATLTVVNSGTISADGSAIDSNDNNDRITNSGTINGHVDLNHGANLLTNSGEIFGSVDTGTGNDTINNTGSIHGDINTSGGNDLVTNAGLIGGDVDIQVGSYLGAHGSVVTGNVRSISGTLDVVNNGDIQGYVDLDSGGLYRGNGSVGGFVQGANGNEDVINGGTILGQVNLLNGTNSLRNSGAVWGGYYGLSGDDTVSNSGVIGDDVSLGNGTNILRNGAAGEIVGNITSGTGADTIIQNGSVLGNVSLGIGDDTYRGSGSVDGTVDGGSGDDRFFVFGGVDTIRGRRDFDTLHMWTEIEDVSGVERIIMRGSDDLALTSDNTDSTINGNHGDNDISAGGGVDVVRGGRGNDVLLGEAGGDTLVGGDGNDELNGGADRDILTGGRGSDAFVFADVADSAVGATRDRIVDFQRGADVIDLSGIGNGAFTFIGGSGFSGSGRAEVRYTVHGPNAVVHMDADGNGSVDSQILLSGIGALNAGDFIL